MISTTLAEVEDRLDEVSLISSIVVLVALATALQALCPADTSVRDLSTARSWFEWPICSSLFEVRLLYRKSNDNRVNNSKNRNTEYCTLARLPCYISTGLQKH